MADRRATVHNFIAHSPLLPRGPPQESCCTNPPSVLYFKPYSVPESWGVLLNNDFYEEAPCPESLCF